MKDIGKIAARFGELMRAEDEIRHFQHKAFAAKAALITYLVDAKAYPMLTLNIPRIRRLVENVERDKLDE